MRRHDINLSGSYANKKICENLEDRRRGMISVLIEHPPAVQVMSEESAEYTYVGVHRVRVRAQHIAPVVLRKPAAREAEGE